MSKVLVVGATGLVGSNMIKALKKRGKKVKALVRPATINDPAKMDLLHTSGAIICEGELEDYSSLIKACDGVDGVISAVGTTAIGQQTALIKAAKETGVQRFMPSDYGLDPRVCGSGSCLLSDQKAVIHKAVKESGLNYTFLHSGGFYEYWAHSLGQLGKPSPPDQVQLYGGGNVKAGLIAVADVAKIASAAIDDSRTLNKEIVANAAFFSQEELIRLWEEISDKKVGRIPVSIEDIKGVIAASNTPETIMDLIYTQILRSVWFWGDSSKFSDNVIKAEQIYPDMMFSSVREALAPFTEEVEMH
jgi:uncharacterized protein YbjT (DUF2867 family)